jgi:prepilin-type N-terminal cleavage/methylation domain-containing protein
VNRREAIPGNRRAAGVTLIEMLIVVAIIGFIAGIAFPSVASGVETLRLNQATNRVAGFLNDALARAGRYERAVEISISPRARTLSLASPGAKGETRVELPESVTVVRVLPEEQTESDGPRRFIVYPGGTPPPIGVELSNARGAHRIVRVDPVTGVPRIEKTQEAK